jgi:hypothetical protein
MRPRRAFRVGLVLTAASSVFTLPAHADFCARLPVWAESGCRAVVSALLVKTGISPGGRSSLDTVLSEDSFSLDPAGRTTGSPATAPPPATVNSETVDGDSVAG